MFVAQIHIPCGATLSSYIRNALIWESQAITIPFIWIYRSIALVIWECVYTSVVYMHSSVSSLLSLDGSLLVTDVTASWSR